MIHWIGKLGRTIRILSCLLMARMFGKYIHSGWSDGFSYARYRWRGKEWIVPTDAVEEAE